MRRKTKVAVAISTISLAALTLAGCNSQPPRDDIAVVESGVDTTISDSVAVGSALTLNGFKTLPEGWEYLREGDDFSAANKNKTCTVNSQVIQTDYLGMGLGDTFLSNYIFQKNTSDSFTPDSAVLSKMEIPALSENTQFLTYEFTSTGDVWKMNSKTGKSKIEENTTRNQFIAVRSFDTAVSGNSEVMVSPSIFLSAACTDDYNADEIKEIFRTLSVQDNTEAKGV